MVLGSNVEAEYKKIKDELLKLGKMVYKQFTALSRAIERHDEAEYRQIIQADKEIDSLESNLDDLCVTFVSHRAPLGPDLRFMFGAIDIARGLERIGDCVEYAARHLREHPGLATQLPEIWPLMGQMIEDCLQMLRLSYESVAKMDVSMAREVVPLDDKVDANQVRARELIKQGLRTQRFDPEEGITMLLIVNKLESAADIIAHISETLIFMVTAQNVRHSAGEKHGRETKVSP